MRETDVVPAVNQVELHPFFTQTALRELHASTASSRRHGRRSAASTSTAPPIRTRSRTRSSTRRSRRSPTKHGKTPAQVILRWHIEHGIVAIPKSVKPHRIEENFDIFDFALTRDEVAAIDALDTGVARRPASREHQPCHLPEKGPELTVVLAPVSCSLSVELPVGRWF